MKRARLAPTPGDGLVHHPRQNINREGWRYGRFGWTKQPQGEPVPDPDLFECGCGLKFADRGTWLAHFQPYGWCQRTPVANDDPDRPEPAAPRPKAHRADITHHDDIARKPYDDDPSDWGIDDFRAAAASGYDPTKKAR